MAATLEIASSVTVTPTVGSVTEVTQSFTSTQAPAEIVKNQVSTTDAVFTIDYGNIAVADAYAITLRAIVGNFYFILALAGVGTTPAAGNSHLYIREGESYTIPLNPNAFSAGICGKSSSTVGQLEYLLIGK
jgi:hypothetical protein